MSEGILFGGNDLIAFWSGVQAFLDGRNPYDDAVLLQYQQTVLPGSRSAQAFLNPPWALPILAIFFWPSFETCRIAWILLNICFLLISVTVTVNAIGQKERLPLCLILALCFAPAMLTIQQGQLSLLVACIAALSIFRASPMISGLALTALVIKPHLLLPLLLAIMVSYLASKRYLLLLGVALILPGFVILPEILAPGIYRNWRLLDFGLANYKTATTVTLLRIGLAPWTGGYSDIPIYAVPIVGLIGTACWLVSRSGRVAWERDLAPIVIVSLLTAPYAWPYDFSLLLLTQTSLVAGASESKVRSVVAICLLVQLGFVATGMLSNDFFTFVWYPWAMLLVWLISAQRRHEIR